MQCLSQFRLVVGHVSVFLMQTAQIFSQCKELIILNDLLLHSLRVRLLLYHFL